MAPPDERMLEAIGMVSSLTQSRKNTEEINLLIREIEAAIESDNRYQLFPGLREAWVNALAIENRILSLHRDLNLIEADLLSASSPQLTAATSERLSSEKLFLALPQNRDEHQLRSQRLALELEQRKLRAYRLRSLIESSDAKVSAIDQWLRINITKTNFDAQQETDLRAGLASARADITSLTAELREAEHQLRILDTLGGLDAGLVEHENNIRKSFKLSLRRERDAMQPLRSQDPDLQRIDPCALTSTATKPTLTLCAHTSPPPPTPRSTRSAAASPLKNLSSPNTPPMTPSCAATSSSSRAPSPTNTGKKPSPSSPTSSSPPIWASSTSLGLRKRPPPISSIALKRAQPRERRPPPRL
jgi:hypothetical protein